MKHRASYKGPAESIFHEDGSNTQKYYVENMLHCKDNPAIVNSHGEYWYYQYNKLDNEYGPACHTLTENESNKFENHYYIEGKEISKIQFSISRLRHKIFNNRQHLKYN